MDEGLWIVVAVQRETPNTGAEARAWSEATHYGPFPNEDAATSYAQNLKMKRDDMLCVPYQLTDPTRGLGM